MHSIYQSSYILASGRGQLFLALLFTRIGGFLVRQVQIGQVPIVWKKREGRERAREREKPPALLLGGTSQGSESPKVEHSQQRRHSRGFMSSPVPRCGTRNAYVCEHLPSWKEPTIGTTNNIYLRSVRAGPFDARPIQPPHLLGLILVHSFVQRYAICYPSGFSAKAVEGGGEVCVRRQLVTKISHDPP